MAKRPNQQVSPADRARAVLRERKVAYADTDVTFDVDGASVDETARAIAAWLVSARGVRIDVAGAERSCRVLIRAGLLDHVGPHLADLGWRGQVAVVSDAATAKRYDGAVHSPDAVFADLAVLATLPARQLSSGLAEVTKCAFIADRESVAQLDRSLENVRAGDLGAILAAVTIAAEVKAGIVSQDPHESGLRELLNFGHTMGRAYEASSGYRVTHGEAVAIGMVYATALAEKLDLTPPTLRPELEKLLVRAALPKRARLPKAVWSYVLQDKKARAGKLRWILPRRIGRFSEVTDVGERALRAAARVVESAA